jgi:pimeloyl-ACP methyl ester carboxylesterase
MAPDLPAGAMLKQPRAGGVRYLLAGRFHWMATHEWGNPAAPPVVCVHGLTRTGRDFDVLAAALSDRFHVICPDLPGRGASDWLPDPALYQPASYVLALSHLLARLDRPVRWLGTSLGGICGMALAACPGTRLMRLVLNDIGPLIPAPALARIRDYIGEQPEFADAAALEAHLRRVHAPFGRLTDGQWAALARQSARRLPDGRLALHYDPAIAVPILAAEPQEIDLSAWWQAIRQPVLAIRGAESDLLLPQTLARMEQDGARSLVVADAGHAPALMDAPTIAAIRTFLLE